jgi:predicted nucleic acid-binding protein
VRALFEAFVPALSVLYVDEQLHRSAVAAHLAAVGRRLSLVDWVSLQMMREEGHERAFAFDRNFVDQGFAVVP